MNIKDVFYSIRILMAETFSKLFKKLGGSLNDFQEVLHSSKGYHDLVDMLLLLLLLRAANMIFNRIHQSYKRIRMKKTTGNSSFSGSISSSISSTTKSITANRRDRNWRISHGFRMVPLKLNMALPLQHNLPQFLEIKPGEEQEMVELIFGCCSQERFFLKNYGVLAAELCVRNRRYKSAFEDNFVQEYFRESKRLRGIRNTALLFAYLLCTDTIDWNCFASVRLNEFNMQSASKLFLKIILQELAKHFGLTELRKRIIHDPKHWKGIFPKVNSQSNRFVIRYLTSIGLKSLAFELLTPVPSKMVSTPGAASEYSSSEASSINSNTIPSLEKADTFSYQSERSISSARSSSRYSLNQSDRSYISFSSTRSRKTHRKLSKIAFSIIDPICQKSSRNEEKTTGDLWKEHTMSSDFPNTSPLHEEHDGNASCSHEDEFNTESLQSPLHNRVSTLPFYQSALSNDTTGSDPDLQYEVLSGTSSCCD